MSFNDFLVHMAPIVIVVMVVFVAMLPRLFRGSFDVDPQRVADVMSLNEREAIRDPRLLVKCGVVLVLVFTAFIAHSVLHIAPSMVALLGAGILVLISRLERSDYLSSVQWETLLFFAGLFIMVGALVKTGSSTSWPGGDRPHRRERAADRDAHPRRLGAGVGHHRQHPLRRDDDTHRQRAGRQHDKSGPPGRLWWALALAPTSVAT